MQKNITFPTLMREKEKNSVNQTKIGFQLFLLIDGATSFHSVNFFWSNQMISWSKSYNVSLLSTEYKRFLFHNRNSQSERWLKDTKEEQKSKER